jgi:hypothetical protein
MDVLTRFRRPVTVGVTAALAATFMAVALPSSAGQGMTVSSDHPRYVHGERVLLRAVNDSGGSVRVEDPIEIVSYNSGETVASYSWNGSDTLHRGDAIEWNWDQWKGHCADPCAHPEIYPPDLVDPGRYLARVQTSLGTFESEPFSIGEYFTLGFRGSDARFSIFSIDRETIDKLRAEAEAEEKTLIVSGVVVRTRASYNEQWPFSLRPRTIEAGETFAEVCDATPRYVARHLEEWARQRWCPWSSYVLAVGTET